MLDDDDGMKGNVIKDIQTQINIKIPSSATFGMCYHGICHFLKEEKINKLTIHWMTWRDRR